MSFALESQKGVRAALVAESNITSLVSTRIYDEPPQNVTYPFVRFGDIQPRSMDTDGSTGAEVTFNVEGYSQTTGRVEATQIAEERKELESICRLYAPIGTWDRFIEYEAKIRKQRKKEAEERQRQIAQTIRYISLGFITVISFGGLSLLYLFTEFLRGLK